MDGNMYRVPVDAEGHARRRFVQRVAYSLGVFIVAGILIQACARADSAGQAMYEQLRKDLASGEVVQVVMYSISDAMDTRVRVTPRALPLQAQRRCESPLTKEIERAILISVESARAATTRADDIDVRFGVILLDSSQQRVHEMYFPRFKFTSLLSDRVIVDAQVFAVRSVWRKHLRGLCAPAP
jgi:hypothetical protein